jgi:hypothetical protein
MGIRPGDSAWFFDMSRDFDIALQFNATPSHVLGISLPFTPAPYALKGTHGIRYGPLPVWIDQVFLAFTSDLVVMSAIRAVVVAGITAFCLLWLTQLLRVSPWLAVVTMCSPWMWYYSRQLWDNSISVPLCALQLAAYGQFIQSKRGWALCLSIVCAALSCMVHLIVLPFLLVLALHALIYETRSVLKFKWPAIVTVVVMLIVCEPYMRYAVTFHGSKVPDYFAWWKGWIFPLFGAQHITAKNIGYVLEESWGNIQPAAIRYAFALARAITFIGLFACWVGMLMGIPMAWRALGKSREATTADHLCLIGLATLAVQTLFDGLEHVTYYPHYYNTTWTIYVVFAFIALAALPRWFGEKSLVARTTLPVYAISLAFVEIIIAWQIARNSGSRGDHYNAVLSNQIEVVKKIGEFSDASPIDVQVDYWQARPETLRVLRQLISPPKAEGPVRKIVVRYRAAFPGDALIVVDDYPLISDPDPINRK